MRHLVMGLACGLSGLTLAVHLFAGGPEYHAPMRALLAEPFYQSMMTVLWHAVTVFLAVLLGSALWLWHTPNRPLTMALGAVMLGWALLFAFFGMSDLGTLWVMPQWIVFVILPGLLIWGHRAA